MISIEEFETIRDYVILTENKALVKLNNVRKFKTDYNIHNYEYETLYHSSQSMFDELRSHVLTMLDYIQTPRRYNQVYIDRLNMFLEIQETFMELYQNNIYKISNYLRNLVKTNKYNTDDYQYLVHIEITVRCILNYIIKLTKTVFILIEQYEQYINNIEYE